MGTDRQAVVNTVRILRTHVAEQRCIGLDSIRAARDRLDERLRSRCRPILAPMAARFLKHMESTTEESEASINS